MCSSDLQAPGQTGSGLVCVADRRASAWSIPGPRAKGRPASQNQEERAAPERPDTQPVKFVVKRPHYPIKDRFSYLDYGLLRP